MKVEMVVSMAGLTFSHIPGDMVEVTPVIGKAWIEAGIAKAAPKKVSKKKAKAKAK
jgi:hypothetical protein